MGDSKLSIKQFGVGVVGYGFIGKMHTYAYKSIPIFYNPPPANVRLVGVCTSRAETAQKAVDHGGYEFGTTDYHEILDRDDIDIINCCTPNHLHKAILIDAMKAGKHVYCDKPLAMNLAEAREVLDAAENVDVVHQMTFQYRFVPAIIRARQLINEGLLGEPMSFRAAYLHSGYIDPNRPMSWRLDKKRGGAGALFDLGSHVLDLVRYLLGECREIFATTQTFVKRRPVSKGSSELVDVEVDDLALIQMKMENGALGTVEASRIATGTNDELQIEIHGREGAIRFDLMDADWLYVYDNRLEGEPFGGRKGFTRIETVQRYPEPAAFPGPKFRVGWVRFHIASMYDFLNNVASGKPSPPTLYDGFKVQEVMEAALESSDKGNWVRLDR
jgi:predicted dehydrogenase